MDTKEIPLSVKDNLCRILDNGEDWRILAGYMGYSPLDISNIAQQQIYRRSPTAHLLDRWSQNVHTTDDLQVLLYKMKHVPAMKCVHEYVVSERVRSLLPRLERDLTISDVPTNNSVPEPVMLIGQGAPEPRHASSVQHTTTSNNVEESSSPSGSVICSTGYFCTNPTLKKAAMSIPHIPYDELCIATDNWAKKNVLGVGGFGEVYMGKWKEIKIAIKKLRSGNDASSSQDFLRELCLNSYRHDNILPLYGISLDSHQCIISQLMAGESLERRLRLSRSTGKPLPILTWQDRLKIAIGTARGLLYLHTRTSAPLIHGDIKPANILLDQCLEPKIADFGLARKGRYDTEQMMVSKIQGTRFYLPDDFRKSGALTPAVDVFSFGLVLAQMATALRVFDAGRARAPWLREYIHELCRGRDLVEASQSHEDPVLHRGGLSRPALCADFLVLGVQCTREHAPERPDMKAVHAALRRLADEYFGQSE